MTRTADVPSLGPLFHLLQRAARAGLELRPHTPPGVEFPHEAVNDSLGSCRRVVSCRCGQLAARCHGSHERHQAPRHRGVVSGLLATATRLARTRGGVRGCVRIPLLPAATQVNGPSQNPLPAAASPRLMPHRLPLRLARTRGGACGCVRIPLPATGTQAGRPSRNPSPAAPSHQPMPDRFCTSLSRTRDAVCGSVRIQDGPHPSRKDTRP